MPAPASCEVTPLDGTFRNLPIATIPLARIELIAVILNVKVLEY